MSSTHTDLGHWDTRYEWKAVLLLGLGFGLVGLDRWIITPLFPEIMRDLKLTYQDVGNAAGALAIVWGCSALATGRLVSLFGYRKVIIPALIAFSLLSAVTGIATTALSLVLVRACMGVAEGAYAPACTAATSDAAAPSRRGLAQGVVFCLFPLFGLGLGPIIATQLLLIVPSWRWVFFLVAIPGLLVTIGLYRILRDPERPIAAAQSISWTLILRTRNVRLAILTMVCGMSGVFVMGAMMPSYLVDYLHLAPPQMGLLMSALGFGGTLGNFLVPAISDRLGRRWTVVGSAFIAAASVWAFTQLGADVPKLYVALFVVAVFNFGVVATIAGPVATESVPVAVAASAIGIVSGAAEIFGGGIAPIVAGFVADHFGIRTVPYIGVAGLSVAILLGALLIETAPKFRVSGI